MADRLRHSAAVASLLSFVLPGLGQVASGAVRRGLLLAIPAVVLVVAAAALWIFDRHLYVEIGLTPSLLIGLVVLSLAIFAYRTWAIVDAYLVSRRRAGGSRSWARRIASVSVLVALLAVTTYTHGWVAYLGLSANATLTAVFSPSGPIGADVATASPTPSQLPPRATPEPTPIPTPSPTPVPDWAADGRLNVLLIGSDAGPGRWSMRADAIILVSVDIGTGRVAAFSVPRYTRGVPLPEPAASAFACGCLMDDYFNALYVYANQHPDLFPGDDATRGLTALSGAAEAFFGVHLDGMVVADLNGFVKLVDAIGGIDINAPTSVYDANYPNPTGGDVEIYFKAGPQHLDGWHALAYARTRHQDGDVGRMGRQQLVVAALRQKVSCDLLGKLPALLAAARDSLWTNLPLGDVPDMLRLDLGPVESHVEFDTYNVTLNPAMVQRVQADVAGAFDGAPPARPSSAPGSSTSGC